MKSFVEIMVEGYINLGECLMHYGQVIELYHNHAITVDLWNAFCEGCLEELIKNNKKVLDNLKSM